MRRPTLAVFMALGAATAWGGDPPRPSPEQDLKAAQGRWRFDPKGGVLVADSNDVKLPPFLRGLAAGGTGFAVEGNRLTAGPGREAVIATDLPFLADRQKQAESSVRGQRLVLLTFPDGKAVLASWDFYPDAVALHYPAGCCSRSGNILHFNRVKE